MEQENKHKSQYGAISPRVKDRICFKAKASLFWIFSLFIQAENRRLYSIEEGRKEGKYEYIPEGWFDFEEKEMAEMTGYSLRNISTLINELKNLGLIKVQSGKKKKTTSRNRRSTLIKNLYQINWELLDTLDRKYPNGAITLDMIRETNIEPSCYTESKPAEAEIEPLEEPEHIEPINYIEEEIEVLKQPEIAPAFAYEYRDKGTDKLYDAIRAKIPDFIWNASLCKVEKEQLKNTAKSMLSMKSNPGGYDAWKREELNGTEPKYWMNQLWNNI